MKYAKTLLLMAVAALTLIAILAPSASANAKVCSTAATAHTPTTACAAGHGWVYQGSVVTTLQPETSASLTATKPDNTTIKCTEATFAGSVTNGTTGTGNVTKLTFGSCSSAFCSLLGGKISVEGTKLPWSATGTTTSAGINNGNGTLDMFNGAGKLVCSAGPTVCEYSTPNASIDFTGGEPASGQITSAPAPKISGPEFTCGTEADVSGSVNVTTPSSIWVE